MGKSWLVSRRRARRPLLPLFLSKATFSVYRTRCTKVHSIDWFRTMAGMAEWPDGRAWDYLESSARITGGVAVVYTKSELWFPPCIPLLALKGK